MTIAELEEPHATQGLQVLRLMVVGSSDSDQAIKATSHSPHLAISARLAVTREKMGTSSEIGEDLRTPHTSEVFVFTCMTHR